MVALMQQCGHAVHQWVLHRITQGVADVRIGGKGHRYLLLPLQPHGTPGYPAANFLEPSSASAFLSVNSRGTSSAATPPESTPPPAAPCQLKSAGYPTSVGLDQGHGWDFCSSSNNSARVAGYASPDWRSHYALTPYNKPIAAGRQAIQGPLPALLVGSPSQTDTVARSSLPAWP